jgi:hypothetical protein
MVLKHWRTPPLTGPPPHTLSPCNNIIPSFMFTPKSKIIFRRRKTIKLKFLLFSGVSNFPFLLFNHCLGGSQADSEIQPVP